MMRLVDMAEFTKLAITPILIMKFHNGRASIAIILLILMMHNLETQQISITTNSTLILTSISLKVTTIMM
jgi:hypothetical protein